MALLRYLFFEVPATTFRCWARFGSKASRNREHRPKQWTNDRIEIPKHSGVGIENIFEHQKEVPGVVATQSGTVVQVGKTQIKPFLGIDDVLPVVIDDGEGKAEEMLLWVPIFGKRGLSALFISSP